MDAAGARGGEEVREADEGLGVARGAVFHQGETGGQECSCLVEVEAGLVRACTG